MNIYVASSWRNPYQPDIVERLREEGHEVYDFRNPPAGTPISWSSSAPWWEGLSAEERQQLFDNPTARAAFKIDMDALEACDVCVLVLPSGRSAHLELGWAAGAGKRTAILLDSASEAELMSLMADELSDSLDSLVETLQRWRDDGPRNRSR